MAGIIEWSGAPAYWVSPIQALFCILLILLIWEFAGRDLYYDWSGRDPMIAGYGKMRWDLGEQRATTATSVPAGVSDVIKVSPI